MSAGEEWALLRAFGPPSKVFPNVPEGSSLFRTANGLDLAARIAARSGAGSLEAEIDETAREFFRASQRNADESVLNSLAAQDVGAAARDLAIPLVYLKFQALTLGSYVTGKARGTSDVDVLVPQGEAGRFRRALLDRGFRPSGCPEYEHQTSPVVHPFGVSVDIHRKLLGVRVAGRRSADARDLLDRGLCVFPAAAPGSPAVPVREVLIAHALVHGIGQNGLAPHAYPLMRMVADLVDLDLPGSSADRRSWAGWISRDVSAAEIDAVARLCSRLRSGEKLREGGAGERAFLYHVLAAARDPAYSRSSVLRGWLYEPTDHSRAGRIFRSAVRALFPSRAQIAAASRAPGGRWRGLWLRLSRPWVLLGRALR